MIAALGVEDSGSTIDAFLRMAQGGEETHGDGWGVVFKDEGTLYCVRSALPVWKIPFAQSFKDDKIVLLHARNATTGEVKHKNSHPFYTTHQEKEWFFCHNGTVRDELPYSHEVKGSTDSEQFFHYLLSHMENGEMAGLENAVSKLENYSSTNFFLMNDEHLYVHRAYKEKADKFTLEVFLGKDVFLASSEPFEVPYKGVWAPLSNKELLKIDASNNRIVEQKNYSK